MSINFMPHIVRFVCACVASLLLIITASLSVARRTPSEYRELIVVRDNDNLVVGPPILYRYNPYNGALNFVTDKIWSYHDADLEGYDHLLVYGWDRKDDGLYRINLRTGAFEVLLEQAPLSENANWVPHPLFYKHDDFYIIDTFGSLYVFDFATHNVYKLAAQLPRDFRLNGSYLISPNRKLIIVEAENGQSKIEVYITPKDGSKLRKVNFRIRDQWSIWLGWVKGEKEWVLFHEGTGIYRIHPDGTGYGPITDDAATYSRDSIIQSSAWGNWVRIMQPISGIYLSTMQVINIDSPDRQWSFPFEIRQVIQSPDGDWIVYTVGDSLYRVRPDGTEQALVHQLPSENTLFYIWERAWSTDGQWLLMVDQISDTGPQTFYRLSLDGKTFNRIMTVEDKIYPFFSPNNEELFYTSHATDNPMTGTGGSDLHWVRVGDNKTRHLLSSTADPNYQYGFLGWGPLIKQAWSPFWLIAIAGGLLVVAAFFVPRYFSRKRRANMRKFLSS